MSYCYTFVKSPQESLSTFNKRLAEACQDDDNPITGFDLLVVSAQPVVTLSSEMTEVTEDDVAEDDTLTLGELVPESDPMIVQVCLVEAGSDEQAKSTEVRLDKVYKRYQGDVIRNVSARGLVPIVIPVPDATGKVIGHVAGTDEVVWIGVGLANAQEDG